MFMPFVPRRKRALACCVFCGSQSAGLSDDSSQRSETSAYSDFSKHAGYGDANPVGELLARYRLAVIFDSHVGPYRLAPRPLSKGTESEILAYT